MLILFITWLDGLVKYTIIVSGKILKCFEILGTILMTIVG